MHRRLHPIAIEPFLALLDQNRLRDLQALYADSPQNYAKYADVTRWLTRHVSKIQDLGLRRSSPRHILDLGCGGGFFLFIARQFGHSGIGLDIDVFPLFRELTDLLQVERVVWTIEPFQALPDLGRKFDLITAFSTRFNRDRDDVHVWDVKDWSFFLDDLAGRLNPEGQVFFEINSGKVKRYYSDEVKALFRRRGASLERDYVFFERGITR